LIRKRQGKKPFGKPGIGERIIFKQNLQK